ncbi:hypothetical protein DM860_017021 [Cuscuta australis]|uniref:F-box domain-containing protein n=2 Tax=Cuscuta australis TaxID=267555 RepID=A0A328DNZ2_9ASTE|nr:hypothetical protein DM860_017021 [Cuscuta australis]
MVLVVGICFAACAGFWLKAYNSSNQLNSHEVDSTSKDNGDRLIDKNLSVHNSEDRISDLPDELLSQIFSHLSPLDAIKKSALSRRWRYVWLTLPCLNLDWCDLSGFRGIFHSNDCDLYKAVYVKKADQILQRFKNQRISSFRLSFCFDRKHASNVGKWINFAAEKHLESLSLQFICTDESFSRLDCHYDEFYVISGSFLSRIPYLKNLHLDSCRLKLHSNFTLNRLKTLDLIYVHIEETGLQSILSRLSTIEWLQLRHCTNLPSKLCIGANLQCLSFLMVSNCPDVQEIELGAENLKTFEFVGKVALKCSFISTPNLERAYVSLTDRVNSGAAGLFKDLGNHIPSLKALFLRGEYPLINTLPKDPQLLFQSVLRLELYTRHDDLKVDAFMALPCLLKSFPLLEKLYLKMPYQTGARRNELPAVQFHANLKEIEFGYFGYCWVEYASYLLRCATGLERMVISRHQKGYVGCGKWTSLTDPMGKKESHRIYIALLGKAASPNVKVIIHYDSGLSPGGFYLI